MKKKRPGRDRIDLKAPAEWVDAVSTLAERKSLNLSSLFKMVMTDYMRAEGMDPPSATASEPKPAKVEKPKRPRGRPRKA